MEGHFFIVCIKRLYKILVLVAIALMALVNFKLIPILDDRHPLGYHQLCQLHFKHNR